MKIIIWKANNRGNPSDKAESISHTTKNMHNCTRPNHKREKPHDIYGKYGVNHKMPKNKNKKAQRALSDSKEMKEEKAMAEKRLSIL